MIRTRPGKLSSLFPFSPFSFLSSFSSPVSSVSSMDLILGVAA